MDTRIDRRRVGLAVMAAALLVGAAGGQTATAQESTKVETPVQAKALLSYPANDAIPDTAFSGVPPQVVCVVEPQLCPEQLEPVRGPIAQGAKEVDKNQETSPLQPANPDGLTITYRAGAPRYASAVQVELPTLPEGHEVDEFVVSFPQGQPSYSMDSPVFRRAVMAVIQTAGSQKPETFQEQLGKALEEEPLTQPTMGIEACPLTVAIPKDAEAPRSAPISAISEKEGDGPAEPAVDCLYGGNGSFKDGTWSFDLTFAAQAWADGTLKNNGILLRPTGAPNLAFGDPDTSTNAQVVLDVASAPKATFASSEPPPPPEPLPPLSSSSGSTLSSPPSSSISSPPSSGMFSAPAPSTGSSSPTTPTADVAPPQTAPAENGQENVALDAQPASAPGSNPLVWLLVPVFAAGAWLTSRSLTEELVVAGGRRDGALTRLVAAQSAD